MVGCLSPYYGMPDRDMATPNLKMHLRSLGLVIGLCRIYAYKAGVFQLFDVPVAHARKKRKELIADGFVVTHTENV